MANGFEGNNSAAVEDAKAALAVAQAHNAGVAASASTLGVTLAPTPPSVDGSDVDAGVPTCILPPEIVAQLQLQLCVSLIQNCDFKQVASVFSGMGAEASAMRQQVVEALNAEVDNVMETAEELVAAGEAVEAVRSYYVALDGIAAWRVQTPSCCCHRNYSCYDSGTCVSICYAGVAC